MEEYIKRETAVDTILGEPTDAHYPEWYASILMGFPAADVAPVVHGLWMPVRESEISGWDSTAAGRDPIGGYICSACKEESIYDCNDEFVLSDYCPNCGAKMERRADNV